MCQVYLRVIMISDIANIQGNTIPPGRLMGQWRQHSWLKWPDIPKPPPTAWETFQRVMMKAFGTCTRIHNPTAEMALSVKLGQWSEAERHCKHSMIRDESNMYVLDTKGWRQYQRNEAKGCYMMNGTYYKDVKRSHPSDGKREGDCIYSHHEYNFHLSQTEAEKQEIAVVQV